LGNSGQACIGFLGISCKYFLRNQDSVHSSYRIQPQPDSLPRIWWCATGPLAFLPIHAAGIYESHSENEQLAEYAISSYTPTISALLETPNATASTSFKLLSVIEPSAPGASYIPNTELELDHVRRHFSHTKHHILEGHEATKHRVTKEMADCNWLHLACHGVQNPSKPTKSALLLHDGPLTLEEIIKLQLPKAEFAFLSACQTTTGNERLSEEAVHIAGGMLLAGYRGVVATMWSIQDELAPEVADEFYAHLMKDNKRPDNARAAEALHMSVQKLRRKRKLALTDWIPFVHLGV
jgi:CHAT domain-containing protein